MWRGAVTVNRRPDYSIAACQSVQTARTAWGRSSRPSTAEDSLARLQRELQEATARAHLATDAFHAIMGDIPSSVPQPDGTQRINNVYRELSFARREMMRAHARLTHFLDTGAVPEKDLE